MLRMTVAAAAAAVNVMYAGSANAKFRRDALESAESLSSCITHQRACKGKVFPYSLPSAGPGADPGVQAVSPQVT